MDQGYKSEEIQVWYIVYRLIMYVDCGINLNQGY